MYESYNAQRNAWTQKPRIIHQVAFLCCSRCIPTNPMRLDVHILPNIQAEMIRIRDACPARIIGIERVRWWNIRIRRKINEQIIIVRIVLTNVIKLRVILVTVQIFIVYSMELSKKE